MKKFTAMILALIIALTLAACDSGAGGVSKEENNNIAAELDEIRSMLQSMASESASANAGLNIAAELDEIKNTLEKMTSESAPADVSLNEDHSYDLRYPREREITMLKCYGSICELRRIVATMAMFAPSNDPALIDTYAVEANAACNLCFDALDYYEFLVTSDPKFSKDYADSLLISAAELRGLLIRYLDEIYSVVTMHARVGDYENALHCINAAAEITSSMMNSVNELIEFSQSESSVW